MSSTIAWTSIGGVGVNLLTVIATVKFAIVPSVPIPSGEIPNNQFSGLSADGLMVLK